jgi:hypothetical protein
MQSLLKFFRNDRPNFKQENQELSEIAVNVLKYQDNDDIKNLSSTLFFALPTLTTVGELKQRIYGSTGIHASKIRIMLCGAPLDNLDFLDPELFESSLKFNQEDDDLYRPRLFMSLQQADPTMIEEVVNDDISEVSELDFGEDEDIEEMNEGEKTAIDIANELEIAKLEEEKKKALEAEQTAQDELNAKAAALEASRLELHKKQLKAFDLRKDLERIQCGHFYDALYKAGFHDEGSFSELDHEQLLEKELMIPRKARTRMIALAVSLKNRINTRGKKKQTAMASVNSSMRAHGDLKGVGIDGIDEVLTNKRDIDRAYKEKVKKQEAEDREQRLLLQAIEAEKARRLNPDPKVHREEVQRKIDYIRWACKRDEYDVPVNVLKAPPNAFCCSKHKKEVMERRDAFVKSRKESNRSDLQMQVKLLDKDNLGFVSRDVLRVVANEHFKKQGFSLDKYELEDILNEAIIDGEDQKEMFEWTAREKYRKSNPFGFIPVAIYDSNYVIEVIARKLEELEYERYVISRKDMKTKYIVNDFKKTDYKDGRWREEWQEQPVASKPKPPPGED